MIHTDIIQGSEEWNKLRLGKVTGSRVVDIVPGVKSKYLASRKNYMAEKVCEILTGESQDHFISEAMQWGTDNEPLARSAYEILTGNLVKEIGFIEHDTINDFGSSPDGLCGNDGGIEIKCPNTATHLQTILKGFIDRRYLYQMQALIICANLDWVDFVSFDPRLPEHLQLFVKRFHRNETIITDIEMEVIKFQNELSEMLKQLKGIK